MTQMAHPPWGIKAPPHCCNTTSIFIDDVDLAAAAEGHNGL